MFFLNKEVHLLASEFYIYQNAWCNNKKIKTTFRKTSFLLCRKL